MLHVVSTMYIKFTAALKGTEPIQMTPVLHQFVYYESVPPPGRTTPLKPTNLLFDGCN